MFKNRFFIIIYMLFSCSCAIVCAQDLTVNSSTPTTAAEIIPLLIKHPREGSHLGEIKSSFVYGTADPKGILAINGSTVPVYYTGAFITMIDYSFGTFVINAELKSDTTTQIVKRKVYIEGPYVLPSDKLVIENVKPDVDIEGTASDLVDVSFWGTTGKKAYFQIEGYCKKYPLTELSTSYYRGSFFISSSNNLNKNRITVTLADEKKNKKITTKSKGTITRISDETPKMFEVISDTAVMRSGPLITNEDKAGYLLFPYTGTRLRVIGKKGDELKVRLSSRRNVWISQGDVKLLPTGTPVVNTVAGSIAVIEKDNSTQIRIPLGIKVPYEIVESAEGDWIDLNLFGAYSNTDWINYKISNNIIKLVQWFQDDTETYRLHVITNPNSWWGYDARYEGTTFVLELRSPPQLESNSELLKGLLIAVDAGHSSFDTGAIGPAGTLEKDVNLAIAKALEQKLLEEGANVLMTRSSDVLTGLYARPKIAWQAHADILISIHNNAWPEGENPFIKNGFGVYYFQAPSYILAQDIHKAFQARFGKNLQAANYLNDDGIHYGNLVLTRPPQLPSVLIECAYITMPREEALLNTKEFQEDCAKAIVSGIKKYAESIRKK